MDRSKLGIVMGDGANLVGHSYGGLGVMFAAARRPEATRSLGRPCSVLRQVSEQAAVGGGRRDKICPVLIRGAHRHESAVLSDLALRSKSHWGYDADFLEACREELTLSPQDFDHLVIRLAEAHDGRIAGFYALGTVAEEEGELWFFFVELAFIGTGVGRRLFEDLAQVARARGLRSLRVDADPGAASFYERMGARRVGDVQSTSIPGRVLPSYRMQVEPPPGVPLQAGGCGPLTTRQSPLN